MSGKKALAALLCVMLLLSGCGRAKASPTFSDSLEEIQQAEADELLAQARELSSMYFYEEAAALLESSGLEDERIRQAVVDNRAKKRLQRMFSKYDLDKTELIKFTLAAYNAGEGRIIDCRNFAMSKGFDNSRWDEIVSIIPLMREDSILEEESVKLGKFQGHETIEYVDRIFTIYNAFCSICPSI